MIKLWFTLIFTAASWVLFILGLIVGAFLPHFLVGGVVGALASVAFAADVRPWEDE